MNHFMYLFSIHNETIVNFMWRAVYVGWKQGSTFVIFLTTAKYLPVQDFGIYSYIMAAVMIASLLGDFGISTAVSKYTSEYFETEKSKLPELISSCVQIMLVFCIVVATFFFFFTKIAMEAYSSLIPYVIPLLILIPTVALFDGFFRGQKLFRELGRLALISGTISILGAFVFLHFFGLIGALIAQNIFYIVALSLFVFKTKFIFSNFNFKLARDVLSYSLLVGLVSVGYYLFTGVNILILGYFGYIEQLATYELLTKLFIVLVVPFAILAQVLAPNLTIMASRKEYSRLYEKVKKYTAFSLILALVLGISAYNCVPPLVIFLFPQYQEDMLLSILPLAIGIFMVDIVADRGIAIPIGYASMMARLYLIAAIINVPACILAVKHFGYLGGLTTTLACVLVVTILLRIKVLLRLRCEARLLV